MNTILQSLFEYFTLRDVLLYSALFLATWLFYKAGIEPFLSPIRKVRNMLVAIDQIRGCERSVSLKRRSALQPISVTPAAPFPGKSSESVQCAMLKACDACADMRNL